MIDLHMHTTASDGAFTVAEVLKKCEEAKLEIISITDHYSVDGYEELKDPALKAHFSGKILPGCEFGCHFNGFSIEILGYGLDLEATREYIANTYIDLAERRANEIPDLIALYQERGLIFDATKHYEERIDLWNELMEYPENQARLINPCSKENPVFFLRYEYQNPNSPFHRPLINNFPSAKDICDLIRSQGGRSFIAHPGIYHQDVQDHLDELITVSGVDGLEIWYPSHTPEQRERFLALCRKYGLLHSGGSDYHRIEREKRGCIIGNPWLAGKIPTQEILAWIEPLRKI